MLLPRCSLKWLPAASLTLQRPTCANISRYSPDVPLVETPSPRNELCVCPSPHSRSLSFRTRFWFRRPSDPEGVTPAPRLRCWSPLSFLDLWCCSNDSVQTTSSPPPLFLFLVASPALVLPVLLLFRWPPSQTYNPSLLLVLCSRLAGFTAS